MRLSPAARRKYTTGSIVTMMSVDAERIYQGVLTSQWVWAGPVVIVVAMALTIQVLGLTGLVGAGVMILAMIYQGHAASKSGVEREALVKLTDERLKLTCVRLSFFFWEESVSMCLCVCECLLGTVVIHTPHPTHAYSNEVLQGIRIIKLYCWESPLGDMIEAVRAQEIVALTRMLVTKITAVVGLFLAPVAVSAATFTAYLLLEPNVSTERVFTALAFCNLIRLPMSSMPNAISNLSDFVIAVKRVNRCVWLERQWQRRLIDREREKGVDWGRWWWRWWWWWWWCRR
jgi:ATP-binding cassette, subfamily C (CFTR/MRP), member 1